MKIRRFNEMAQTTNASEITLRYWAFDWDDNILDMPTKILMDQKIGNDWKPVEVSTAEFAQIRNDVENYRIRNGNPSEAFSEFRDNGVRGSVAFVEDVEHAISNGEFGPAFEKFLQCLSEGGIFSIITARGHEPETIKKGVEYIIDEVLMKRPSETPGMSMADEMFQNVKKFLYWFEGKESHSYRLGGGSQNPIIQEYLNNCDFYGVSSESFAKKFSGGTVQSPEESKKKALRYSIDKCVEYAAVLEDKMNRPVKVTFGMSDDDPRTSQHIKDLFRDIMVGEEELMKDLTLAYYQTTDPKNVEKTIYKKNVMMEASHQAPGTEGSTVSLENMTKRLYPNSKHSTDDYRNQLLNRLEKLSKLKKTFAFNRNESLDTEKTREEMIDHLCNCGYRKHELENYSDEKLKKICGKTPQEISERKKWK